MAFLFFYNLLICFKEVFNSLTFILQTSIHYKLEHQIFLKTTFKFLFPISLLKKQRLTFHFCFKR
ncbi:hypothetical protein LEP1GSC132_4322 [Leptospira kirschneri str. 200803703]|uniref:Uncharacterized protein n=1 Tax=Leptospira kirschneri str. 200802841 TaxID=1193047 RepID=A0A828XZX2_9LEPT|nr:hypothetical protein LEP1GSC131_2765 [Leptospira kirschneri str. 200802841]EMK13670.1 hypothetical protein LEP1GSC042_0579 [Leptospira kirschneri serovar Bim str. PUO 1247]EMN03894.1 hypothetical protein LEP1GSC046_0518 [Leptospira kirschneri serovar Bim str. 1051]EMO68306.1 hypothetical protein LEP1GSC132_4322 [Leptospira kirschneri str. 200803703]EPG49628.1 hypothetical protein LEP1GSC049_1020 [Leptospira kirschneri serovar Cynopteri str. 3522 CT]